MYKLPMWIAFMFCRIGVVNVWVWSVMNSVVTGCEKHRKLTFLNNLNEKLETPT
jgi:hypothetical protein